jgi:uncharacterized protein (TIGR04255 family)
MPSYPHLENAPIIEAVVDIRLEPLADSVWDSGVREFTHFSERYPTSEPISRFELSMMVAPGQPPSQELHVTDSIGIRFSNETEVLQLRIDGITYSKLKPYTSWDSVFETAWNAWNVYRSLQGGSVSRIATRFINKIQFSPLEQIGDYIRQMPGVPANIPGSMRSFFSSHDINISDNTGAKLIQGIEPQQGENMSYILDIDAFRIGSYDVSDPLIESGFTELHDLKNSIFFNCITEQAVKKWQ